MKQYYKILHEDMKHYDMQYHLGLNEDVKPFDPSPKFDGGIFFSDKEHVLDYLYYNQGTKIAIIEVPEGEQIVKVGNKYKSHRIIIKEIHDLWIETNYEWLKSFFADENSMFQKACRCGTLNFAKWLYAKFINIDIHNDNDYAFQTTCENGHLEVAQWLYVLGGINIHADNEYAFRLACVKGHLEVAQWVHCLGNIDIHAENEYAFRLACKKGHLEVAQWLHSLGGIDIQSYRNELFGYVPEHVLNWLKTL